jgi:hypothetical protein
MKKRQKRTKDNETKEIMTKENPHESCTIPIIPMILQPPLPVRSILLSSSQTKGMVEVDLENTNNVLWWFHFFEKRKCIDTHGQLFIPHIHIIQSHK